MDKDDDCEIELSPLCREETRDGVTVEIHIYRGPAEGGMWILEVVDEEDASTVWDELLETDQDALFEAMRAIEEEGIATFLSPPDNTVH